MTSVEIMDYGTNLQYERQSNEFYDYFFSHNVSTYIVRFAVIFYIVATLLTVIVDTSTCYDIVGLGTVFVVICSQIPFSGRSVRSVIHIIIILLWSFIQFILSVVYWQLNDRRFEAIIDFGDLSYKMYRLLLYIAQGIQLTLVSWMTIRMIKSDNINGQRGRQNALVMMTGWFLAIIGLIVSSVYFEQLKLNDYDNWNWHYGGEILMWLGLNLSALSSLPENLKDYIQLLAGPLCYVVPYNFFLMQ